MDIRHLKLSEAKLHVISIIRYNVNPMQLNVGAWNLLKFLNENFYAINSLILRIMSKVIMWSEVIWHQIKHAAYTNELYKIIYSSINVMRWLRIIIISLLKLFLIYLVTQNCKCLWMLNLAIFHLITDSVESINNYLHFFLIIATFKMIASSNYFGFDGKLILCLIPEFSINMCKNNNNKSPPYFMHSLFHNHKVSTTCVYCGWFCLICK